MSFITNSAGRPAALTRKVIGVMGLFGSVEMLGMLCGVIRTKLIAIFTGAAGVGLIGLYTSAIEMLSAISQLGLRTSGVRHISAASECKRPQAISVVIRLGHKLAWIGIIIALLLSPVLSLITFDSTRHTIAFACLALAVGANTITSTSSAVMQATGQLSSIARASAVATIISLAAAVPMVIFWGIDSIIPMLLAYSLLTFLAYAINCRIPRPLPAVAPTIMKSESREILRLGAYLTVSNAATWFTGYLTISALNHIGGETVMGLYQSGYTITIRYVGTVFTALSLEYFPRLSAAMTAGQRRAQTMMRHETIIAVVVTSVVASMMALLAPLLVRLLYSDSFLDVVPMIQLAAPGVVLRAISWSMAFMLPAAGRGRLFMLTELSSCIISLIAIVGGYLLYGMAGIGIGFTLWYGLYSLIILWAVRSRLHATLGLPTTLRIALLFLLCSAISAATYFA